MDDIIKDCRDSLRERIDAEDIERRKMEDDLRFCTLDQWPSEIRNDREDVSQEGGPRPCLTIDKINQYIVQVVNDMRQGKPGINVRPMDDQADVETAKVLKGLIRNIEDQSKADIAYATAGESAAKIGLGFIRVTTEYVSEDSFDQEIFIRPVPNTFNVYLGQHVMPDGSDAKKGWVVEVMPVEKFKEQWPDKKFTPDSFDDLEEAKDFWVTEKTVTVVEYFYFDRYRTDLLALEDGTSITQRDYDKWPASQGPKPKVVDKRPTMIEQLKWAKMTGLEVLEKRDLPGKYIPIIEVVGRESVVKGQRILWGLVRPAKDSLRMYNYFASAITERMGLAPMTPFVAAEGQIEGREQEWKDANRKKRAVLQYKPVTDANNNQLPPPQRQAAMPIEAAMTGHLQVIEHDVQTALGMFKAAVGETESQQSGRAILALQRESDTGTYHFGANLGISIRHVGVVILDMIPHYYDTRRVMRILGDDGEVQTVTIDPEFQKTEAGIKGIYNPTVGKYDVAITVGPSYNTKRMEAAATLTEVVKSQPQLMPFIGDLLFRSLDFPYSDQIAERMKKMLPPPLQDQNDPAAKLMQAMQQMQMMGQAMQEMKEENLQLKAGAQEGMAKVQIQAQETQQELALQKQKQDGEIELARQKAEAEIAIKRAVAEAEHSIRIAEMDIERQHTEAKMKMEHDHKTKEADFNMKMKAQEAMPPEVAAQAYKQQLMETDVMPPMMAELQKAFAQMGDSLGQMVQLQQQTLAAIQAPKSVSIGNIQTDASGMVTGAQVNTRIALNA